MNISNKTIEKASELLDATLKTYRLDIDKAFLKADDALSVSLGLKFKPSNGKMEIETSIKFVTDQVSDKFKTLFDENQEELFPRKEEKKEESANGREKWFSLPKQWPAGATLIYMKPYYKRIIDGIPVMMPAA
jgi:hypothetical protein